MGQWPLRAGISGGSAGGVRLCVRCAGHGTKRMKCPVALRTDPDGVPCFEGKLLAFGVRQPSASWQIFLSFLRAFETWHKQQRHRFRQKHGALIRRAR